MIVALTAIRRHAFGGAELVAERRIRVSPPDGPEREGALGGNQADEPTEPHATG